MRQVVENTTEMTYWEWEIAQAQERPEVCVLCRKIEPRKNMVRLDRESVPSSMCGFYHPKCASRARIRYKKICAFCNNWFVMSREDGISEVCPNCYHGENKRMHRNLVQERYAARKYGYPADLTMAEWLETLEHFKYTCAYCGERPYRDIEHFMPVRRGGGTTRFNCVPACHYCNTIKGHQSAFEVFPSVAPSIAAYLNSRE